MSDRIYIKSANVYKPTANDKIKETADETGIIYDNMMSIKNKNDGSGTIWCDKDRNGYYDTQVIIDESGKKQTKKLDEKNNNVKKVQSEIFNKFSKKSDEYLKSKIHIDGKIDNFKQGDTGDCWLLSGIDAVNRVNSNSIKKTISQDKEGNVIVSFKGTRQKYKVTLQEILDSKDRLSKGDDDVKAIELAAEKYRKNLILKKQNMPFLKKAVKINPDSPLDYGTGVESFMLLTGDSGFYIQGKDRETFLKIMQNNPKSYAAVVTFKEQSLFNEVFNGLTENHAYSIKSVDDKYITVINPWNNKEETKIKRKDFLKNIEAIAVIDGEKVN